MSTGEATPSHSFSIIHTKRVWSLRRYSIFRYGIFLFHARFVSGSLLIAARTLIYLEMSSVQIRRNFRSYSLCMYLCIKSFFYALTLFYLLIYIPFHFIWALFCVIFIWVFFFLFFILHFVYNTKSESFMSGRQHDEFYQSDVYVLWMLRTLDDVCWTWRETTIVSFRQKLTIINTAIVIILFSLNCPEHFSPLFTCRWCSHIHENLWDELVEFKEQTSENEQAYVFFCFCFGSV